MAREDDPARAFRALYETTHLQVLAYCLRRTSSRDAAMDAASETYVVVWRKFDQVSSIPDDDRLMWLFAVARRVLANQNRSVRRQDRTAARIAGLGDVELGSPEGLAIEHEERRRVLEALTSLRPDEQELLRLDAWEGLSAEQLAEYFGCSQSALYVRMHRARKRLASAYERTNRRRHRLGGDGR
jgi:RNA polymerase sigma-70 factor (ECF subfamily)